ncbi:MAG TPA: hypothetical protein VGJ86_24435 [Acidimicrobiales bacterium]|jgi:hypothetical protein
MTQSELSRTLTALERDVRQTWAQLLEIDAAAAGQLGAVGRLIHRANVVLDDKNVIY